MSSEMNEIENTAVTYSDMYVSSIAKHAKDLAERETYRESLPHVGDIPDKMRQVAQAKDLPPGFENVVNKVQLHPSCVYVLPLPHASIFPRSHALCVINQGHTYCPDTSKFPLVFFRAGHEDPKTFERHNEHVNIARTKGQILAPHFEYNPSETLKNVGMVHFHAYMFHRIAMEGPHEIHNSANYYGEWNLAPQTSLFSRIRDRIANMIRSSGVDPHVFCTPSTWAAHLEAMTSSSTQHERNTVLELCEFMRSIPLYEVAVSDKPSTTMHAGQETMFGALCWEGVLPILPGHAFTPETVFSNEIFITASSAIRLEYLLARTPVRLSESVFPHMRFERYSNPDGRTEAVDGWAAYGSHLSMNLIRAMSALSSDAALEDLAVSMKRIGAFSVGPVPTVATKTATPSMSNVFAFGPLDECSEGAFALAERAYREGFFDYPHPYCIPERVVTDKELVPRGRAAPFEQGPGFVGLPSISSSLSSNNPMHRYFSVRYSIGAVINPIVTSPEFLVPAFANMHTSTSVAQNTNDLVSPTVSAGETTATARKVLSHAFSMSEGVYPVDGIGIRKQCDCLSDSMLPGYAEAKEQNQRVASEILSNNTKNEEEEDYNGDEDYEGEQCREKIWRTRLFRRREGLFEIPEPRLRAIAIGGQPMLMVDSVIEFTNHVFRFLWAYGLDDGKYVNDWDPSCVVSRQESLSNEERLNTGAYRSEIASKRALEPKIGAYTKIYSPFELMALFVGGAAFSSTYRTMAMAANVNVGDVSRADSASCVVLGNDGVRRPKRGRKTSIERMNPGGNGVREAYVTKCDQLAFATGLLRRESDVEDINDPRVSATHRMQGPVADLNAEARDNRRVNYIYGKYEPYPGKLQELEWVIEEASDPQTSDVTCARNDSVDQNTLKAERERCTAFMTRWASDNIPMEDCRGTVLHHLPTEDHKAHLVPLQLQPEPQSCQRSCVRYLFRALSEHTFFIHETKKRYWTVACVKTIMMQFCAKLIEQQCVLFAEEHRAEAAKALTAMFFKLEAIFVRIHATVAANSCVDIAGSDPRVSKGVGNIVVEGVSRRDYATLAGVRASSAHKRKSDEIEQQQEEETRKEPEGDSDERSDHNSDAPSETLPKLEYVPSEVMQRCAHAEGVSVEDLATKFEIEQEEVDQLLAFEWFTYTAKQYLSTETGKNAAHVPTVLKAIELSARVISKFPLNGEANMIDRWMNQAGRELGIMISAHVPASYSSTRDSRQLRRSIEFPCFLYFVYSTSASDESGINFFQDLLVNALIHRMRTIDSSNCEPTVPWVRLGEHARLIQRRLKATMCTNACRECYLHLVNNRETMQKVYQRVNAQ